MNIGGSYIIDKDGKEIKESGTVSHPEGDRARTADGKEVRFLNQVTAQKTAADLSAVPPEKTTRKAKTK